MDDRMDIRAFQIGIPMHPPFTAWLDAFKQVASHIHQADVFLCHETGLNATWRDIETLFTAEADVAA